MKFNKLIITNVFCILSIISFSQNDSKTDSLSKKHKRIKILPVPTFGYEPETKTHIGAVSLFTIDWYQDTLARKSNAKVEFNYTWRRQIILETGWNYFFKEEKWFTSGLLHFSKYPDLYYGIGPETELEKELLFSSNRTVIDLDLYKNLGNQIFIGAGVRYYNYNNISSDSLNLFDELESTSVLGIKAAVYKDSRNNLLNTTAGNYYKANLDYNFSASNYLRFYTDIRKYYTLKDRYTLALRQYNSFNFNTPSFFDYSVLGGDKYVRGYFYGRYRDKNLSTIQVEFRAKIFWRIGLAAIGGVSTLYSNSSTFDQRIRPNYGLGLRFLVDTEDDVNLRFDYVLGTDGQSGFYISFGESF